MLCPNGVMEKSVKYILTLVFILSVVSAAAISLGKWEYEEFDFSYAQIDTSALDISAARYVYASALQAEQIDFSEITVCTDKTESGSISISKVIICSDCEKQRILAALAEVAENTKVEIINE